MESIHALLNPIRKRARSRYDGIVLLGYGGIVRGNDAVKILLYHRNGTGEKVAEVIGKVAVYTGNEGGVVKIAVAAE